MIHCNEVSHETHLSQVCAKTPALFLNNRYQITAAHRHKAAVILTVYSPPPFLQYYMQKAVRRPGTKMAKILPLPLVQVCVFLFDPSSSTAISTLLELDGVAIISPQLNRSITIKYQHIHIIYYITIDKRPCSYS